MPHRTMEKYEASRVWEAPWGPSEKAGDPNWRERHSLGIEVVGFSWAVAIPRKQSGCDFNPGPSSPS